jgi:hypothetical protein
MVEAGEIPHVLHPAQRGEVGAGENTRQSVALLVAPLLGPVAQVYGCARQIYVFFPGRQFIG